MINKILVQMREINNKNHKIKSAIGLKEAQTTSSDIQTYKVNSALYLKTPT